VHIFTTREQLRRSFWINHQCYSKQRSDPPYDDEIEQAWASHVKRLNRAGHVKPGLGTPTLHAKGNSDE
jgi:hypothetical protein